MFTHTQTHADARKCWPRTWLYVFIIGLNEHWMGLCCVCQLQLQLQTKTTTTIQQICLCQPVCLLSIHFTIRCNEHTHTVRTYMKLSWGCVCMCVCVFALALCLLKRVYVKYRLHRTHSFSASHIEKPFDLLCLRVAAKRWSDITAAPVCITLQLFWFRIHCGCVERPENYVPCIYFISSGRYEPDVSVYTRSGTLFQLMSSYRDAAVYSKVERNRWHQKNSLIYINQLLP